jgi:hypothetical protein
MSTDSNEEDEKLEGESNYSEYETDNVYPNAEVRVEKAQYSTVHLKRLVEDRKELEVDPNFQRNSVWDNVQCAELVESILMGIPIPTIYLFEMKNGKKQVVDGRQRISAILDFLNNKFTLSNLKILHQYNGKKFRDLDVKMQGVFEDYQLSFYIIQPPTPERVKYDIFDRVNRGGTRLNSQEMRNALYTGKATELLNELAQSQLFLDATGKGINAARMKDRYLILRSIAFFLSLKKRDSVASLNNGDPIEYKSDMDDFLAKIMIFLNQKATPELLDECMQWFYRSMDNCLRIMGKDAFRFPSGPNSSTRRPINMPLFEVMAFIFADASVNLNPEITRAKVNEFKNEFEHERMFTDNVDSAVNLKGRFHLADDLINQLKNDTEN